MCYSYYFVFMSVGACERVPPAVSNMLVFYSLSWQTQYIKALVFMQKTKRDYLQHEATDIMFSQLPKGRPHEIRWSMPEMVKHQISCSWVAAGGSSQSLSMCLCWLICIRCLAWSSLCILISINEIRKGKKILSGCQWLQYRLPCNESAVTNNIAMIFLCLEP